jgi:hypothetical protein
VEPLARVGRRRVDPNATQWLQQPFPFYAYSGSGVSDIQALCTLAT